MNREEEIILFETSRNAAVDDYFNSRPQIERTQCKEKLVEAGFRMAWDLLKNKMYAEAQHG